MRVLFLHQNHSCYLAESLGHGLKTLLGPDCVDVPRYDSLYAPLTPSVKQSLRSHGFTLYGLLQDQPELVRAREQWRENLKQFDLVVLAHIWEQGDLLKEISRSVPAEKIILLDGTDGPIFFPFAWSAWNLRQHPSWYFLHPSRYRYFKRELIGEGEAYNIGGRIPCALRRHLPTPGNARPISFSIPEEKIRRVSPADKTKPFPRHIVDGEVAARLVGSVFTPLHQVPDVFTEESAYYEDLRVSRFGITTRRAGWDCLRHYELASQGCVLCFRDLDLKPDACAPHGLNPSNCILYRSDQDLQHQIAQLSSPAYATLQENTYRWVAQQTTRARANQFLAACEAA